MKDENWQARGYMLWSKVMKSESRIGFVEIRIANSLFQPSGF
jgi:hypothetical protein